MEAVTVRERGWGSKGNGELLGLAEGEFDAFLTTDKGIPHQQDLAAFDLAVVLPRARSNDYDDLAPLITKPSPRSPRSPPKPWRVFRIILNTVRTSR